jgi:hypothetical protein
MECCTWIILLYSWAASLYALWIGSHMVPSDRFSVLVLIGVFKFRLLSRELLPSLPSGGRVCGSHRFD